MKGVEKGLRKNESEINGGNLAQPTTKGQRAKDNKQRCAYGCLGVCGWLDVWMFGCSRVEMAGTRAHTHTKQQKELCLGVLVVCVLILHPTTFLFGRVQRH